MSFLRDLVRKDCVNSKTVVALAEAVMALTSFGHFLRHPVEAEPEGARLELEAAPTPAAKAGEKRKRREMHGAVSNGFVIDAATQTALEAAATAWQGAHRIEANRMVIVAALAELPDALVALRSGQEPGRSVAGGVDRLYEAGNCLLQPGPVAALDTACSAWNAGTAKLFADYERALAKLAECAKKAASRRGAQ